MLQIFQFWLLLLRGNKSATGLIRFRAAVARASEHDPPVFFCMGASTAHTGSELLRAQREASAAMVAEKLLRKKQREQQEKEQEEAQEEGTPE